MSGNPPELTDAQLASFRGPMGGARMLTADEALTLLTAYDGMVTFKRGIQAALDGESANDTHAGGIRCLRRERDDLRRQLGAALVDAAALRRDFPPAPPLPTLGCQCRTCAILRRQQDERP